ncbi:VIT1/CCC1 transporter family protein [Chitinophaga sp. S165]|uniref:VIT1/CCC1 transporter family protein n=1 Tax=Chitinophaga sp. S165 TaxID=2135462 RepID=UPI000D71A389|nr:VIT1/CCC1 transporter family protein [Chitinophaga sp. S165]PWV55990.1 VIT family protein [Chitinophaga sp. S165]
MSKQQKAIRSSGWKTDFLIGFPDGLLLLFFTTFLLHGLPVTVQQFYTLNVCIWLAGGLLVMISAYRANHGDAQHDESTLSPEERQKLERLNISNPIIEDIAAEMQRDAVQWEETLEAQQVRESHFSQAVAIRGALFTGFFFLLGGILPFLPYLRNENFTAAANSSLLYVFIAITVFSLLKSGMTSQPAVPIILRNLAYGGAVWLGAYIILAVFR